MPSLIARVREFLAPFHDVRALTWIAIGALTVGLIDPVMLKTVVVWSIQFAIFVGVAVIASRHVFPQVSLTDHVRAALGDKERAGNPAAGLVVLAVAVLMAALIIGFSTFARV